MLAVSLALIVLQGLNGIGPRPQPAHGPTSTVIAVIVPNGATSSMVDALNRLRGEATSLGFEIRLVGPLSGATQQAKLEAVARELSPAAVVALSSDAPASEGRPAFAAVDVWFLDRATGKLSIGHLPVGQDAGDRAEQALAVGVVDFIRARMFDSLVQSSVESTGERKRAAPPIALGRYRLSAGLGALGSFAGLSTTLLPVVEASFAVRPWLWLSVSAGGLGTEVERRTAAGSLVIEQRLLKGGAAFVAPALMRRWYLHAEAGLGMLFVATHGEGSSGYVGQATAGSSLGVSCLGGVLLALGPHVVLQTSVGTLWLFREQQVFIADDQVARTGRPTWLGSAMVGVRF